MTESVNYCQYIDDIKYNHYILTPIFSIAAVTMVPLIYSFIAAYHRKKLKTSQLLFSLDITMYISIFAVMLFTALANGFICDHLSLSIIFDKVSFYMYGTQNAILVIILFYRLTLIFRNTPFQIQSVTIKIFIAMVIFGLVSGQMGLFITFELSPKLAGIGSLLQILTFILYIVNVIWLNYLFINKLYKVHRADSKTKNGNDNLINIMTKTGVLIFISISGVIIFAIYFYVEQLVVPSFQSHLVEKLLLIVDLYTNFSSVYLAHRYYDEWYNKACGCCHRKCLQCWVKCLPEDINIKMMEQEIKGDEEKIDTVTSHSSNV